MRPCTIVIFIIFAQQNPSLVNVIECAFTEENRQNGIASIQKYQPAIETTTDATLKEIHDLELRIQLVVTQLNLNPDHTVQEKEQLTSYMKLLQMLEKAYKSNSTSMQNAAKKKFDTTKNEIDKLLKEITNKLPTFTATLPTTITTIGPSEDDYRRKLVEKAKILETNAEDQAQKFEKESNKEIAKTLRKEASKLKGLIYEMAAISEHNLLIKIENNITIIENEIKGIIENKNTTINHSSTKPSTASTTVTPNPSTTK